MNAWRAQLRNPIVAGILGILLGGLIGVFIIGYWLWPVNWYDAAADQLRPDLKEDFLRAAIDAYVLNRDAALAKSRFESLGADAGEILATVQANPGVQEAAEVQAFSSVVRPGGSAAEQPKSRSLLPPLLIGAGILVAALIIVAGVLWIARRGQGEEMAEEGVGEYAPPESEEAKEDLAEEAPGEPEAEEALTASAAPPWATMEETSESPATETAAEVSMPEPAEEKAGELEVSIDQAPDMGEKVVMPQTHVEAPPALAEDENAKMSYSLEYIEGIGPVYAEMLRAVGIATPKDLLEKGGSPKGRQEISLATGISEKLLLGWINHVDLFRIKGVGSEYADLLEAAGVDSVVELARRNPANLYQKLAAINIEKRLVRKLPFPSQVDNWIAQAKQLPRMVSYD